MRILDIENLFNVARLLRPIVAYVTLFAFLNAFVLPISSAVATDDETKDKRKVIVAKITHPQEETEPGAAQKSPNKKSQKRFNTKLKSLKSRLAKLEEFQVVDPSEQTISIPSIDPSLPVWEQKFTRIGHLMDVIKDVSEQSISYFQTTLEQIETNHTELEGLKAARNTLKKKINKTFTDKERRKEVRAVLNTVGKTATDKISESQTLLDAFRGYLDETEYDNGKVISLYQQFQALEPSKDNLWTAKNLLKPIYSIVKGMLPKEIRKNVKHIGLLNSSAEEMEESSTSYTRGLGKFLQLFTPKVVLALMAPQAVLQAEALSNANVVGNFANAPYDIGTPTFLPPVVITGGVGQCFADYGVVKVAGDITATITTPSTTLTITQNANFKNLNIMGPCDEVTQHTNGTLRYTPKIGYTGSDVIQGDFGDANPGLANLNMQLAPNSPVPPGFTAANLGTITNGATVPLTSTGIPITDPKYPDSQVQVNCVASNGNCALASAPSTPANFTKQQINAPGTTVLKHSGNNQAPDVYFQACNPTGCTPWVKATENFVADTAATPVPSSGPDIGTIVGITVPSVLAVALAIAVPLGVRANRAKTRFNYPIANFVYQRLQLDVPDFNSGGGATFSSVIQNVTNFLKTADAVNLDIPSMDTVIPPGKNAMSLQQIFVTTHLIPAIEEHVTITDNSWPVTWFWGKKNINIEDLQAEGSALAIANSVIDSYNAANANNTGFKRVDPIVRQRLNPLFLIGKQ